MRSKKFFLRKNGGFLLLELVTAVTVVGVGLLFISRSYGVSKKLLAASSDAVRASLLLEEAIFPFEEKGEIEDVARQGKFQNIPFGWRFASRQTEEGLEEATMEIYPEKNPSDKTKLVTYFLKKEEKNEGES